MTKERTKKDTKHNESLFESLFSYEGYIGRLGFLGGILFLNSFAMQLEKLDYLIFGALGLMIIIYSIMALVQKRCRDIGFSGTLVIIVYTIFYISVYPFKYMISHKVPMEYWFKILIGGILTIFLFTILFLLLLPGTKTPNPNLRSPLLKYPFRYVAFYCFCILTEYLFLVLYYE